MFKKIEDFLFGQLAGRVLARLAVSAGAALAAKAISVGIHVDPGELSAALMAGANAAYTAIKEWRDKRATATSEAK